MNKTPSDLKRRSLNLSANSLREGFWEPLKNFWQFVNLLSIGGFIFSWSKFSQSKDSFFRELFSIYGLHVREL